MRRILISACIAGLMGCSAVEIQREVVLVTQREMVMPEIEVGLLRSCATAAPPLVKDYMDLSKDAREYALTQHILLLYTYLSECTLDKKTLLKIQERHRDLVDQYNRDQAASTAAALQKEKQ